MSTQDRWKKRTEAREAHRDQLTSRRDEIRTAISEHVSREISTALKRHLGGLQDRARPGRGSKGVRLDRDQIAAAALAIADSQGFEAVTMRKIAAVLGVGTMSLYHYIHTKDDLVALMDDAILGEILLPSGELPVDWREAMSTLARRTNDTLSRHPWAMTALMQGRPGPNGVRHFEQSLAALTNTDLDPSDKFMVIMTVDDFVFGHVMRSVTARNRDPAEEEAATEAMVELAKAQVATGRFPEIAALLGDDPDSTFAQLGTSLAPAARFETGLKAVLDGLAARFGLG